MTAYQDRPCGGSEAGQGDAGGPHRYRIRALPDDPRGAELARHTTQEALVTWRLEDLADTAVLLVSELVTNAVLHAKADRAPIALILESHGGWLRIEVHDADPRWLQPRCPGVLDESGFGLLLVDALASKWGVDETATGKTVWAELGTQ